MKSIYILACSLVLCFVLNAKADEISVKVTAEVAPAATQPPMCKPGEPCSMANPACSSCGGCSTKTTVRTRTDVAVEPANAPRLLGKAASKVKALFGRERRQERRQARRG